MNTYGYVGGNPLGYVDSLGLDAEYVYEKYGLIDGYSVNARAGVVLRGRADDAAKNYLQDNNIPRFAWDDSLNGGVADAVRHCVWTCEMTREGGYSLAKDIADMHERDNGVSASDMDAKNNQIGCFIGENGDNNKSCEKLCVDNKVNLMVNDYRGNTSAAGDRRF